MVILYYYLKVYLQQSIQDYNLYKNKMIKLDLQMNYNKDSFIYFKS